MNLYLRYFDIETLVTNVDDAIDFLASIPEIQMDDRIAEDVRAYFESDMRYPKRYKVRPRIYFIMIKTEARNMQEFKEKKTITSTSSDSEEPRISIKEMRERENNDILTRLTAIRPGWYEGEVNFKRVITIPSTGKHEYRDCNFAAYVIAESGQDCYNRIIDHLSHRVDSRSQFPSVKGRNYRFRYLGQAKPINEQ